MPKPRPRTPTISFRLKEIDQKRLDDLCLLEKRNRPDMVRQAVIWYLDHQQKLSQDLRETNLERRIKKMEDRICGLVAKGNIDVNTILQVIYLGSNAPLPEKAERYKKARGLAVKRLKQKLEDDEELKRLYMQDVDPDLKADEIAP